LTPIRAAYLVQEIPFQPPKQNQKKRPSTMKNKLSTAMALASMNAAQASTARNYINSQGELLLYGIIGDWWDGLDAFSVVLELERMNPTGDLHVRIQSDGGNYLEGLAIYNALKRTERRVIVTIDGWAASMATIVALAGDVVRMPQNAWQFFHFAGGDVYGNHEDLRSAADQLEAFSQQAADIYAAKSDLSADEWLALMRGNTWFNATKCLEIGLIDEIIDPIAAVARKMNFAGDMLVPVAVMELMKDPETPQPVADHTPEETEEEDVKTAKMTAGAQVPATPATPAAPATPSPAAADMQAPAAEMQAATAAAATAERTRQAELRTIAGQAPSVVTAEMLAEWCDGEMTADAARTAVLKLVGEQSREQMPNGSNSGGNAASANLRADITAAVLNRVAPGANRLEGPNEFAHMSLMDVCRSVLSINGVRTNGMTPMQIAGAALQSTSDLPAVFADVANNELARGYAARQRTFTRFANRRNMTNFKPQNITRLSDAPQLLPKTELGAYQIGQLTDSKETLTLQTKGRMVNLSREMIINDDMDALSRLPMMMGAQASLAEIRMIFGLLASNPTMGETGKTLFHADHKNIATAAALSVDSLGALRALLRKQKSKAAKGETGYSLNTPLDFLIVPAALETEAQKIISQISPTKADDVNPFANLELIAEAVLDETSETAYFGIGSASLIDTIEYGYLDGQEGAFIDSEVDFDTDGIKMKVRHDFAAGVADYRGMTKNAGVAPG
jgi:ATP-dependent protease ClpP protease subunit